MTDFHEDVQTKEYVNGDMDDSKQVVGILDSMEVMRKAMEKGLRKEQDGTTSKEHRNVMLRLTGGHKEIERYGSERWVRRKDQDKYLEHWLEISRIRGSTRNVIYISKVRHKP